MDEGSSRRSFDDQVTEAARLIEDADYVHVVSHNDADGIATASVLCSCVHRMGGSYHFRALDDPNHVTEVERESADDYDLVVFCDLGAAYTGSFGADTVVVDHHPTPSSDRDRYDGVLVTPRHLGEEASSSVAAVSVAERLDISDTNVVVNGLLGAEGDGVMDGQGSDLVDDVVRKSVEEGHVTESQGVRIVGEKPSESLAYSTHPYTEYTGDIEGARRFVTDLGMEVDDRLGSVGEEELRRFSTAVVLLAAKNDGSDAEAVERLIGDVYSFDSYPRVPNLHTLSRYVEACGKTKPGLALSVCLSPVSTDRYDEVRGIYRRFQSRLIDSVREAEVSRGTPAVVELADGNNFDTGSVADVYADWIVGTPVLVVNNEGESSLRSSEGDGHDAGAVLSDAASRVGGRGGGHPTRAGATVPVERTREFVESVEGAFDG
ncbi:MAG: DHHA1 domain-containing protein [Halobacteria archaeon]|nr:DHHA1 domain-containing protein [Halobacteria archaeon]